MKNHAQNWSRKRIWSNLFTRLHFAWKSVWARMAAFTYKFHNLISFGHFCTWYLKAIFMPLIVLCRGSLSDSISRQQAVVSLSNTVAIGMFTATFFLLLAVLVSLDYWNHHSATQKAIQWQEGKRARETLSQICSYCLASQANQWLLPRDQKKLHWWP